VSLASNPGPQRKFFHWLFRPAPLPFLMPAIGGGGWLVLVLGSPRCFSKAR